ncbi:LPXTG cell wall anchor domain-containing protein [Dactylosporangium sp. McL0621]|uniref:LPXTG cell wall anchor domain-containing protein n=1 Tax=Dactylosporangium sp. McL0621 TaxID=3415678 RepID=UPI003CE8F650
MRALAAAVAVAGAALAGAALAVLPATAALAADPQPDLAVTIAADQPSYAENAPFSLTVVVTNHGAAKSVHSHIAGGYVKSLEDVDYGALETGFDLDAAGSKTFTITGKTTHQAWRYGGAPLSFTLESDNGDANPADNSAGLVIKVPGAFGDVDVQVCVGNAPTGDCGDGSPGAPGITVIAVEDGTDKTYGQAVTDAKGIAHLTHLPAGSVGLRFSTPPGWQMVLPEGGAGDAQVVEGQRGLNSVFAKRVPVPSSAAPSAPALPVTGSDTAPLVGGGIAAVLAGAVLILVARRRRIILRS